MVPTSRPQRPAYTGYAGNVAIVVQGKFVYQDEQLHLMNTLHTVYT